MKQYRYRLWLTGLMLLSVCVTAQAGDPEWKAVFNQLPEDIQNQIIDEATKVYEECSAGGLQSSYYDCRCVSNEAMRLRTESGPGPAYYVIRGESFNDKACINYSSIVAVQHDQCMSSNEAILDRHAEPFCKCYAKYVADAFLKEPYLASESRGLHAQKANQACDRGKYLNLAAEALKHRQVQAEAARPQSERSLSPYPWEWIDLGTPPQELHEQLLAGGFQKSVAWDACFISKKNCHVSYETWLSGNRRIEIDISTRKGQIISVQTEAKYSQVQTAEAKKRLGGFVTAAMLKPLPDQRSDMPPACNAQRTTCYNLPDPNSRSGRMPPMFHYFYLSDRHGGSKDTFLHYEISPRLRGVPAQIVQ